MLNTLGKVFSLPLPSSIKMVVNIFTLVDSQQITIPFLSTTFLGAHEHLCRPLLKARRSCRAQRIHYLSELTF